MQRWWYSDDKNNGRDKLPKSKKSPMKRNDGIRKWKFCVVATCDLNKYEKLAVTGSCEQLGEWEPDQSVLLNKEDGEKFETLPKNMTGNFMFSPRKTFLPLQKKDIFSRGARSVLFLFFYICNDICHLVVVFCVFSIEKLMLLRCNKKNSGKVSSSFNLTLKKKEKH